MTQACPTAQTKEHRRSAAQNHWKAWLWRQLRVWHWTSSALSLVGMVLFAFTGITLNHAGALKAKPEVKVVDAIAPDSVLRALSARDAAGRLQAAQWFRGTLGFEWDRAQQERQGSEILANLPRPGGDAWLTVDLSTGRVHMETTDRGWIAYLNDLHKGRHTGQAWSIFLDVFAGACILFCLTGLGLLVLHAPRRPMTWPAVLAGLAIPALLAAWFLHP